MTGEDPLALLLEWCGPEDTGLTMVLATLDATGAPVTRTLRVSGADERGRLRFHTDSRSDKVAQLAADPRASATVTWPGRQLVVTGVAERTDAAEADRAWLARPRALRLLGHLNEPEIARLPAEERRAVWEAFDAANPEPTRPESWIGFAIRPDALRFWEVVPGAGSSRREFRRSGGGWEHEVLPG